MKDMHHGDPDAAREGGGRQCLEHIVEYTEKSKLS